ncbi:MAG: ATP-binding cassette domain-containing protein, partial [Bacilli bacterium]
LHIKKVTTDFTKTILELKGVGCVNEEGTKVLDDVNFSLRKGEILGIAGINGHGQKELCEVIAGIRHIQDGAIFFHNKDITKFSVKEILREGIQMSFVPEDRLGMGLVPHMNVVDNVLLKDYYKKGIFLDYSWSEECTKEIVEELDVQTSSVYAPISLMSGGNIQKVLIGREIKTNPELLITAYPVRGLDINTTLKIYSLLQSQKQKGVGIIYIAEDLDSLLELSDRLLVLHHGKVMGIYDPSQITKEDVGLMMVGRKLVKNA